MLSKILHLLLCSSIFSQIIKAKSIQAGTAFTELVSDNKEFALKIELEDQDSLFWGHLVLYHQVNNGEIQLWHSDYHPTNGTEAFLDEADGTFVIRNSSQITWSATLNESVSCKAAIVDLTDSGQLSLKCADGFIKWSPDTITVYSTDVSKPESEECYFLDSPEIRNDWEKRLKLGLRCMKIRSPKYTFGYGARAISFDDLKCGVRNASSVALIESSDTCWSQTNNNLNTDSTIFHSLRLIDEDYYKDYKDVRKKRFKARKLEIENKWNRLYLTNSSIFLNAGFESLIVSEMKQPENMSIPGVFVTAIVLFALPISKSSYLDEWNRLSDDDGILEEWTVSDTSILQAALTCPAISSLQSKMSADLWEASTLDSNIQPKVGTTIDFQCPSDKQLSDDSDGYHANDDKFTVLCTTRGNYEVPRNWPTCVRFCPIRMPYKPLSKTGLVGVEGLNTVPSGKYGRYICQDTSLGVDRGPSEFFKVQCNPDGYYDVPKNVRDWPICMARTTTMSPVLPVALKNMMSAFTQRLEFRLEAYAWTGDGPKIETKTENYLLKIVAPVAGTMGLFVILVLCLSRNDSILCKICEERKI